MSLVKKVSLVSLAVALAFGGLAAYRYHDLKKRMEEIDAMFAEDTDD